MRVVTNFMMVWNCVPAKTRAFVNSAGIAFGTAFLTVIGQWIVNPGAHLFSGEEWRKTVVAAIIAGGIALKALWIKSPQAAIDAEQAVAGKLERRKSASGK